MPNTFLKALKRTNLANISQALKPSHKQKVKKRPVSRFRPLIFVTSLLLFCGLVDSLNNLANSLGDLIEKSLSF